MTTIAWDGKTLAADKQTSCDGSVYRRTVKIEEVSGGYLACCGNVAQINHFLRWYRAGRRKAAPTLDELGAIEIHRGHAYTWEGDSRIEITWNECVAIGSGWSWAAAAMDFGKTAEEAVAYAATRDNGTGGGIDAVTITQPRRKPARKG